MKIGLGLEQQRKARTLSHWALLAGAGAFDGGQAEPLPLAAEQAFSVNIVASKLSPLLASQGFSVDIVASESAVTPLTLVAGADLLQWCRPDLGLTIGVGFDWQDQHTSNKDYTNAAAAAGPSLNATDGPNSTAALVFDGAAQSCTAALQLPAPGTTPTLVWMLLRQDAWVSNENVISGNGGPVIRQSNSSPNLRLFNGSLAGENSQAGIGVWRRVAAWYSNSTSDFIRVRATTTTGTSAGNNADSTAQRRLGANAGLTTFTAMSIADIVYAKPANQADALTMVALLDSDYGIPRYGTAPFS